MPKRAPQIVIDSKPSVVNGEIVTAATVVQVTQLAMGGPFRGDFQITDQGRLIVGEDVNLGPRVIVSQSGAFGHDLDGVTTFAVVSQEWGPWGSGDVFAGYVSGNYLLFDQSEGTLGVYSPAGAGFIAAADGSLYAGDTDGAHMRWNTTTRAIEVRNGDDVKISLDANGDASFDGTVYASGGRIYGQMQVDGLLRAGDVDGPSVNLGKFSRIDSGGDLVESGEIIATDANNMPWFHVTAGGSTAGGGWFHLGGTGDFPQRLTYDGQDLVFDGTLYARGGSFSGDITVDGDLTITTGSITTTSVVVDNNGITFDAITGKYDGAGLKWATGATEYLRIGTQVNLGVITGTIIENPVTGGTLTFSAGTIEIVGNGSWRPASNSTTALQLQNAAGTAIVTVDTTNAGVKITNPSGYVRFYDYNIAGYLGIGGDASLMFSNTDNAYRSYYFYGFIMDGSGVSLFYPPAQMVWASHTSLSTVLNELRYEMDTGKTLAYQLTDNTNNAVSTAVIVRNSANGAAANGFGVRQLFELETSTTAAQTAGAFDTAWTDATDATRTSRLSFSSVYAGTLYEGLRVGATSAGSQTRIGDAAGSNYSQFDATGHLTFAGTAKPWQDMLIEPIARTTGTNAPTFEKWYDDAGGTSRGVYLYSFDDAAAGSEKEVFFNMQMSHAWDGGDVQFHVHWIGAVDDTTATPRWGLEYVWREPGGTYSDTTIVYATGNHLSEADVTANKHYITAFTALSPGSTADDLSSVLIGRLFRNSSNAADTYNATGAKCGLLYIDAHYQLARIGSNDEYSA